MLVRVTTGVEAHTHEFMATAHDDQKFGFSLSSGAAAEAVRRVLACPGLDLGACTRTSGRRSSTPTASRWPPAGCSAWPPRSATSTGCRSAELNLGGGLGIAYTADDDPADIKIIAQNLHEIVRAQCASAGLPVPRLTVEPGRAIAGPGTVTLYEVGTVKDVDGLRSYVSVDGGMSDNIRTALYDAEYTPCWPPGSRRRAPMLSRVVGKHCESGDIVVRDCCLPVRPGPRRPARGRRHRRVLPVDGQQLQPHRCGPPWWRSGMARPGCCCAGRPSRTCSGWTG